MYSLFRWDVPSTYCLLKIYHLDVVSPIKLARVMFALHVGGVNILAKLGMFTKHSQIFVAFVKLRLTHVLAINYERQVVLLQ